MPPRVRSWWIDSAQQFGRPVVPTAPFAVVARGDDCGGGSGATPLTARRGPDGSTGPAKVGGGAFGVTAGLISCTFVDGTSIDASLVDGRSAPPSTAIMTAVAEATAITMNAAAAAASRVRGFPNGGRSRAQVVATLPTAARRAGETATGAVTTGAATTEPQPRERPPERQPWKAAPPKRTRKASLCPRRC